MASKLFVGNLSFEVGSEELQELFAGQGEVVSATVVTDRDTGKPRGFGFVEMAQEADAQKAIQNLDGREFMGRNIKVNVSVPREPRSGGNRGWGGGRSRR